MKIYKVSQSENTDYDSYDSFVCYARTRGEARVMYPGSHRPTKWDEDLKKHIPCDWFDPDCTYGDWASSPDNVSIEYIGRGLIDKEPGVIMASFNAG